MTRRPACMAWRHGRQNLRHASVKPRGPLLSCVRQGTLRSASSYKLGVTVTCGSCDVCHKHVDASEFYTNKNDKDVDVQDKY